MTACVGATASVEPGQTAKASTFIALGSVALGIIETASRSLLPLSCPDEDIGSAIGIVGTCGYGGSAVASTRNASVPFHISANGSQPLCIPQSSRQS